MSIRLLAGHCLDRLAELPADSVQSCVTSPPYFQLRAYGTEPQVWGGLDHEHEWTDGPLVSKGGPHGGRALTDMGRGTRLAQNESKHFQAGAFCACGAWRGELGQEPTPDLYVSHLVDVFRAVRRVLRPDGVLLLNIGDSYAGSGKGQNAEGTPNAGPMQRSNRGTQTGGIATGLHDTYHGERDNTSRPRWPSYAKPKDLLMIPARVALALQADGWWIRGDYIWHKPACMPESVTDRCTRSHEYVWHLTKSARYFWNQDAIRDDLAESSIARLGQDLAGQIGSDRANGGAKTNGAMKAVRFGGTKGQGDYGAAARRASGREWEDTGKGANKRTVWTISTAGYAEAHFATMPPALAEMMVKATTREGDTVIDPFGGVGTTALAADRLGRHAISIELNPSYMALQEARLTNDSPLFADVSAA